MWKRVFLSVMFMGLSAAAAAQDGFTVSFFQLGGAAVGPSSGGAFVLQGTVGQPAVEVLASASPSFRVTAGFWPGVRPALTIRQIVDVILGLRSEGPDLNVDGRIDAADLVEAANRIRGGPQ